MKKLFLSVIGISLIVGCTACGGNVDIPDKEATGEVQMQSTTESQKQTASESVERLEASSKEVIVYEPKQEILEAKHDSGLIQVNDQLIQLPIHLSELIAMGFDYELDNGHTSKDYLFSSRDNICMNLILGDDKYFVMNENNPSEEEGLTIEQIDPLIKDFQIVANVKNTIYFPGGLIIGGPAQAMHDNFGEPVEVSQDEWGRTVYTYGDDSTGKMMVYILEETQTVNLMNIKISETYMVNRVEEFVPITFEGVHNIQDIDILDDVTMLYAPDYFLSPDAPCSEWNAYVEADNEEFLMRFICDTSLPEYYNPQKHYYHGEALYNETDENGVIRRLFCVEGEYILECVTEERVFNGYITFENKTNPDIDPYEKFKNLAIDMAASIEIS